MMKMPSWMKTVLSMSTSGGSLATASASVVRYIRVVSVSDGDEMLGTA